MRSHGPHLGFRGGVPSASGTAVERHALELTLEDALRRLPLHLDRLLESRRSGPALLFDLLPDVPLQIEAQARPGRTGRGRRPPCRTGTRRRGRGGRGARGGNRRIPGRDPGGGEDRQAETGRRPPGGAGSPIRVAAELRPHAGLDADPPACRSPACPISTLSRRSSPGPGSRRAAGACRRSAWPGPARPSACGGRPPPPPARRRPGPTRRDARCPPPALPGPGP